MDNTEFVAVVHQVVANSKECIEKLQKMNEHVENEELKSLIVSAAALLTIHNSLIAKLAEENSNILDRATELLEKLRMLDGTVQEGT
jgi:hypothetical protein